MKPPITFTGLDVETKGDEDGYGLQPWRVKEGKARITALSVVGEHEKDTSYFSKLEPTRSEIRKLLINLAKKCAFDNVRVIGWNTPFDVAWLIAYGFEEECRNIRWADGEILLRALTNSTDKSQRYGLKGAVAKYLPDEAGYEKEVAGDFSKVDATLLKYNRADSHLTARIGRIFWSQLSHREKTLCGVISSAIVPFASAWVNGLEVDRPHVERWRERVQGELDGHRATLETQHQLTPKIINSPVQLRDNLIERGYNIDSVDRTTLTRFKGDVLIDEISAYKKANTALTKFIGGIDKSLEYNGGTTTHPSSRLWNTYTGRVGYYSKTLKKFQTGIAIHQWTRGAESRNFLKAPDGFLLAEFDFATQESRLLADFSDDPVLLNIFRTGLDFHTYMASEIAQVDYESMAGAVAAGDKDAKNFRQLAKVVNLSLAYRTSWGTLINTARKDFGITLTEHEAQGYHGLFRAVYTKVSEYWDYAIHIARYNGYAETRGGRKVRIDDWSSSHRWASESTAINFPIQGTGADMKYLAIGCVEPALNQMGGRYLLDLHDALNLLIPDDSEAESNAKRLQRLLSNLPYERVYGWTPKVPMPVGLKIGKTWGAMREL